MKFRVGKREIAQHYALIQEVPYDMCQTLLCDKDAMAYSIRVEGWACDYYDIGGVLLCTGYSPIGKKYLSNDELKEYEEAAEKIRKEESDWEELKIKLEELRIEMSSDIRRKALRQI